MLSKVIKDLENCPCGRVHSSFPKKVIVGTGAIKKLPEIVAKTGVKSLFVLADENTYQVAGKQVENLLKQGNISVYKYILNANVKPNEQAVGSAIMHYNYSAEMVVAVGSGVVNDIGKILSKTAKVPYVIVGTAPSMDGYASATSSMDRDGLKISLPSKSADIIIGDTDILKTAPDKMLKAGLGDMLAKYVSICEWRISNEINGEYYCPQIASLVRKALSDCVQNANGLLKRDDKAIEAVFKGLILCGEAMSLAGLSRPASGVEHYISHVLDMRGLEFGCKTDLHGIQCAIGTLIAVKIYEQIKDYTPNEIKAIEHAKNFNLSAWNARLQDFLGSGAKAMIEQEKVDKKYDAKKHLARIKVILQKWDKIKQIISEELPPLAELERLFDSIELPKTLESLGCEKLLPMIFASTKDIRDKYVLSTLCWDLGVIDEIIFKGDI